MHHNLFRSISGQLIAPRAARKERSILMNYSLNKTFAALSVLAALGCSDTLRAQTTLTVTPTSLAFNGVPANSISQPQNLQISWNSTNTGTAVATASQSWIVPGSPVNFNSTPTALPVRVNTQGLVAGGQYNATLTVTVSGQSALSQTVNVTANPAALSFTTQKDLRRRRHRARPCRLRAAARRYRIQLRPKRSLAAIGC